MNSLRAAVPVVVLVAVAAVGAVLWVFKPRALHGDSRRAAASQAASERVAVAVTTPAAVAAASVAKIGEANAAAPDSPAKEFIAREVPVALANLPAPDAAALLAAEQRKVAVMSGQIEESRRLYADAMQRAESLQRERAAALAARSRVDAELAQVAAERLAAEHQRNGAALVALLALALWAYVKITHLSPGALADVVGDIKAGVHPIAALDAAATRLQQKIISRAHKLRN